MRPPDSSALYSVRGHSLYVAPIRLGLAALWIVLAQAAGASRATVLLAAVGSAFMIVFVAFNDPRSAFLRRGEPAPVPEGAVYASPWRQALAATMPSTVGVSVLAAIALAWQPTLTAVLGGVCAGLGVAGLLHALRVDPALWFDPHRKTVYRRT